jgi:hypothetical protein
VSSHPVAQHACPTWQLHVGGAPHPAFVQHCPSKQLVVPAGQTRPQPPQLFGSVPGSTQPLAQQVSPWTHPSVAQPPPPSENGVTHCPLRQLSPFVQRIEHPPQLFGSPSVSMHPSAQHDSPSAQPESSHVVLGGAHVPWMHE